MLRWYVTTLWICSTFAAIFITALGKPEMLNTKNMFWAYTILIGLWVLEPVAKWLISFKITIKKKQNQ